MPPKRKSLLGAVLLLSGSCIGAGMLGLPISSGLAGFGPSFFVFLFSWAFMVCTGLILMEANVRLGSRVSLTTLAEKNLGKWAQGLAWIFFLFLFYALGVAYISGSGALLSTFLQDRWGIFCPASLIACLFALLFGVIVYLGTHPVVRVNRYFMAGLILFYFLLVLAAFPHVRMDLLTYSDSRYALFSLPIMVLSFGYHNMIPSLNNYFEGETKKLYRTIWSGSFVALGVYLVWQLVVLGIVPVTGKYSITESLQNDYEGAQALILNTKNLTLAALSGGFAFFAIATSFLAQSLSLVDFWADGLKISASKKGHRLVLVLLAIVPSLVFSLLYPKLFLRALGFGGGICAMVLFGILPALMCIQGRKRAKGDYRVFGGTPLLVLVIMLSLGIIVLELLNELGFGIQT